VVLSETSVLEFVNNSAFGAQAVVIPPIGIWIDAFTGFSITAIPVSVQPSDGIFKLITKVSGVAEL
jgi:hypothetical protein